VKKEKANNNATNEDEGEDEDEDGGRDAHHGSHAARVAKGIYKKALKTLKFKLYFENFFPTDEEKDGLPYSCWISAIESSGEIEGGSVAAHKMFYDFGYDDTVRAFTLASGSVP
jgi:hypothetical protein